jgi:formylglycine-generating enzyme required for sulfatase activity
MDIDMKFAWVPPGAFLMGAKESDEEPVHRVRLTKGFYMGIVPVTQAQWQAVMDYNPSTYRGGDRPVEMVSWLDCQEFRERLRQLTNKPIRLPTEAEWEYACRAGTTTAYCNGNAVPDLKNVGWYDGNSGGQTQPVGKLAPNAWGLYDMHGNVREWCQDGYTAYPSGDNTDPLVTARDLDRVLRGGDYSDGYGLCRAASRRSRASSERRNFIGCRVAFGLE